MTDGMYEPTVVASRIEQQRKALRISLRSAAASAGLSESRWRQIAKGYQQVTREAKAPVNAPFETLAKMARAVGLGSEDIARLESANFLEGEIIEAVAEELKYWESGHIQNANPSKDGEHVDLEYVQNLAGWIGQLESRVGYLESRLFELNSSSHPADAGSEHPDYSQMSDQDAKDYGLAAYKGEENIAHDDLPHEP